MALETVKQALSSLLPRDEIRTELNNHKTVVLDHFTGSAHAFAIAALAEKYPRMIVICNDEEHARFVESDLEELDAEKTHYIPPSHKKPYDKQQIIDTTLLVRRSEILQKMLQEEHFLTVTSSEAIFDQFPPPESFTSASIQVQQGSEIEMEGLKEELVNQNYSPVKFVSEPGEFASRGGILDVFPYSGEYPVRLEFFGDEVDSIREFDPDSQRSISFLKEARFVPDTLNLDPHARQPLLSYLQDDTVIVLFNAPLIRSELQNRFEAAEKSFDALADESTDPTPPEQFVSAQTFDSLIEGKTQIHFGGFSDRKQAAFAYRLNASPQPDFNGSIKLLREDIQSLSDQGYEVYILCDNEGQRDRFEELLGEPHRQLRYHLLVNTIHEGFILKEKRLAVYTDHQIFNRYHRPKTKRTKVRGGISFKELRDLNVGDYVVHVDYGIGKFAGFKKIEVRGIQQESVVLRYKEDSVLYVNVSSLHKLQKYSGKEGTRPRMTKLGSGQWARKKAQTKKKVKDIARDLIKLYAKRKAQKAHAFSDDTAWQTEMEARFEFEETPDQRDTIQAVKQDMETETPMDRLICGDVGFGKTEVAVRAAFKAVMDHKQVAVLVPTTILADQHFNTFSARMKDFPVKIEMLSRFRTKSEQKKAIEGLAEGSVDIVIGTHRITSKDIEFKNLGLLIVDEEQRFGVSAKEKLKKFRATVDVLTLTATPIPRTLQFSLMGARDLSIINTPPPNRQPVQTEIHSFNDELIRDAITHEMSRGGQIFFIHNRVKNIEEVAVMVRRLVPDVRVRFAHGQMNSSKLEKIIADFYRHKFDVLVSTNIVENGIDIANANTMIINRADRFGLAELHQLRGRVGRSNRKAFCFLITPPIQTLTPEARKRLLALEEFSDLGSGFNIAMRDLDIRGAGDMLGAEQSGFINDVGFEMYKKILDDAVKELKEDEFSTLFSDVDAEHHIELPETQVEFDLPALLDDSYVSDNVERLNLYRKLARADSIEQIDDWEEEVKDRFGPIPQSGKNLITATRIKLFAAQLLFTKITVRKNRMWIVCPSPKSEAGELFFESRFQDTLKWLQQNADERFRVIQKNEKVRFVIKDIKEIAEAADFLKKLNDEFSRVSEKPVSV